MEYKHATWMTLGLTREVHLGQADGAQRSQRNGLVLSQATRLLRSTTEYKPASSTYSGATAGLPCILPCKGHRGQCGQVCERHRPVAKSEARTIQGRHTQVCGDPQAYLVCGM